MDNRKHKSKMMGDTKFLFLGTKINVLEYMVDLKLKINKKEPLLPVNTE